MHRTILLTGAGGSIGRELARQLNSDNSVSNLIINDISEAALFESWQNLVNNKMFRDNPIKIIPVLGDISSRYILQQIEEQFQSIDIIYHAAAYKHVNMSMQKPMVYYKNNIEATQGVIGLASRMDAKVVHISTDKAVNPCNHMGYSKRLCEFLFFSNTTRKIEYKIVRFGNVLNSAGSVIPIFQEQISHGGPVTVTDAKATRFFMSISEAVGLVRKCYSTSKDYSINILDMGEPQLIDRLARNLIEQAGYVVAEKKFSPNEIEIHYIGLRDGEKLHEQLSYGEILPTNVPEIKCSDEVCSVNEVFLEDLLRSVFEGSLDILELVDWSKGEYKKCF